MKTITTCTAAAISLLGIAALPGLAQAQTTPNPAYVEKAQIVGSGNTIKLFGLPAKDNTGKTKYWDTTITIEIDANGRPKVSSPTAAVWQSGLKSTEFVQGNYVWEVGSTNTCTLVASPFVGRNQFDLRCNGGTFVATWYTGAIAGHPWETDLVAAGLDTVVGANEYSWGKTVYNRSVSYFNCFYLDNVNISARQVGDRLTLTQWGGNNVADCQATFVRQP